MGDPRTVSQGGPRTVPQGTIPQTSLAAYTHIHVQVSESPHPVYKSINSYQPVFNDCVTAGPGSGRPGMS